MNLRCFAFLFGEEVVENNKQNGEKDKHEAVWKERADGIEIKILKVLNFIIGVNEPIGGEDMSEI